MFPRRSFYFLPIFILPLLVVFQNPNISEPVHAISLTVLKPVLIAGHAGQDAISKTRDAFLHFWKTFQDQGKSQAKISALESELLRFKEISKENERLQKLLDFKKSQSSKMIAARVIGWDPAPWRKTIILDKGKNQGIKKDMAVIVPTGLVGRVIEMGPNTSRVILLIDSDGRVGGITEQSRAQGVVGGDGSSRLKMTYLELDSGVAVEEKILTSGVGGIFPKGIGIGKIVTLGKDSDGLHLAAQVEPFVAFSKLEEVLCLEPSH